MSPLQSSRLVALPYQRDFHPRLADLNKRLRYFLGGLRPTQTAHQALSPAGFAGKVRTYTTQERYFTGGSIPAKTGTSKPPVYATHVQRKPNTKLQ